MSAFSSIWYLAGWVAVAIRTVPMVVYGGAGSIYSGFAMQLGFATPHIKE
jgi:hypothetical protein